MSNVSEMLSGCPKTEGANESPRYDISIYETPFSKLPEPKRVWLGSPSSTLEGLGRLSLLTPDIVSAAAVSEIKTGRRVGLNWNMRKLEYSQFGRQKCNHTIKPLYGPGGIGLGACFDDIYEMNPQQSSQWDGFRHYSQPQNPKDPSSSKDRVFYGGTTEKEIYDPSNYRIGIQHWASEGIAGEDLTPYIHARTQLISTFAKGRGILLDYHRWAPTQSPPIKYSCFSTHSIPFSAIKAIKAMCKAQNVTPQKGDVLFVRTGMIPEWDAFTDEAKREYAAQEEPEHAGVEASIELLEWLWDSGITAVAGDAISWEVFPTPGEVFVHEYLLGGWGMPIGEMFDLEALSKTCAELQRYTFFLTSMPLNMPGGVSSPPNAMAIF